MLYSYIDRHAGTPDFKFDEEVLSLQPIMIPPKRFGIFFLTGGCSDGVEAFRFFFKKHKHCSST